MVNMDVGGKQDGFIIVMLEIIQCFFDFSFMVVINKCYDTEAQGIFIIYFFAYKLIPYKVSQGFGAVRISFF